MKRDLKNMGKQQGQQRGQQPTAQDVERAKQNIDSATLNNVQSVLNQYGHKSEAELLKDLKSFQQAGIMDRAALYDVAQKLGPMLNPEQQQKLYAVMQELGRNN